MEQGILLHWKSPLLCIARVSNVDVTMSAYDFCLIFLLQPDRKTILLGTAFGKMKEFNLMTGQVRENFSPRYHRDHHYCDCIGHLTIAVVISLIIIITVFQHNC